MMRKAVTLRLEPEVLAEARNCARTENRTLTNFIETLVKQRISALKNQRGGGVDDSDRAQRSLPGNLDSNDPTPGRRR